jgi:hypothetical protein
MRRLRLTALVTLALWGTSTLALATTPVVPTKAPALTAAQFLQGVATLERAPLAAPAHDLRAVLLKWTQDSPDVTVNICPEQKELMVQDPIANLLWAQGILGNSAYQLQHTGAPAQASETAGLQSLVKVYTLIRQQNPNLHNAYADRLLQEQAAGGDAALAKHTCAVTEKGPYTVPMSK